MAEPAESPQPSIRRLAAFSIRPRRDLGQNFLIDSNILGVIERGAELGPEDVVLEVGGGLGVLSEHLAALRKAATPAPARMSGSGACVFAEFTDSQQAAIALQHLPTGMRAWAAAGLDRHPLFGLAN